VLLAANENLVTDFIVRLVHAWCSALHAHSLPNLSAKNELFVILGIIHDDFHLQAFSKHEGRLRQLNLETPGACCANAQDTIGAQVILELNLVGLVINFRVMLRLNNYWLISSVNRNFLLLIGPMLVLNWNELGQEVVLVHN
jgi:hypothetical protein